MKKLILLILFNFYAIPSLACAAPEPLQKQTHPLYILSNMACTVSILCRMKTPTPKIEDENIAVIPSEPGKKTTLNFEKEESFYLRGISVQPHKNLPTEYTESSEDSSLTEYGLMLEDSPVIGNEPLVLSINETFTVKGYLSERNVIFTHTIDYVLQKTGNPTDTPISRGKLPRQPASTD